MGTTAKFDANIYRIGYWRNGTFYESETPCATLELAEKVAMSLNEAGKEKSLMDIFTYLPSLVRTE